METNTSIDHYPSRSDGEDTCRERLDPVVYSRDPGDSPLAPEFIEQYREQGYLLLDQLFSESELQYLKKEADRMLSDRRLAKSRYVIREPEKEDVRSIFMIHALSPVFTDLASDSRLAGLAEYILDDRVYVHQSRLNYKPGFRGKEFYWHSDFETWHVEDGMPRMRAMSMSIALTGNYEINGPLLLIPGSHNEYISCAGETPENHFRQSLKKQEYGIPNDEILAGMADRYGIVSATTKPGSVIVFDCNMMHGSNSNITPYARSNIFLVYNAVSNRVIQPYCNRYPRPEHVASRHTISPVTNRESKLENYA